MYTIEQLNAMTPEEFDKVDPAQLPQEEEQEQDDEHTDDDTDANNDNDDLDDQDDDQDNDDDADDADDSDDDEQDDDSDSDTDDTDDTPDDEEENPEDLTGKVTKTKAPAKDPKQDKPAVKPTEETEEVDHADFYAKVTSEFKANGGNYAINKPEDIVSLMQKGLNYNQKMNAIKPYMGVGKLLEENALLDPEKLSFLIDLHNKKPEAIAKLIQDSGIDAYELDEEKAKAYQATPVNIPSENESRMREIVQEYKEDADFIEVYNSASKWDDKSQQELVANPGYLTILTEHRKNGVYDKVMAEVNYLINVKENKTPVIELYHAIGSQMYGQGQQPAQAPAPVKTNNKPPVKVTKRVDPLLEQKRKIMRGSNTSQPVKRSKASSVKSAEDIYSLSPEEFANIDPNLLSPNT